MVSEKYINRIYHYTQEGTRESHPKVHNLQSTIDETCRDNFSPTPSLKNNPILMLFKMSKAQHHYANDEMKTDNRSLKRPLN